MNSRRQNNDNKQKNVNYDNGVNTDNNAQNNSNINMIIIRKNWQKLKHNKNSQVLYPLPRK